MKIFISLLLINFAFSAIAKEKTLLCTYKVTKQVEIPDTSKIEKYEKTLENGLKEVIVINDPWTLNGFDNYIVFTKGEHTMTYSLDCKKTYTKDNK